MEEDENIGHHIILICFILGCICAVELIIFGYGMIYADKVECTWWGCKFTDIREMRADRSCTMNGIPYNCSDEVFDYEKRFNTQSNQSIK